MKAMILAAGLGTRLQPYSLARPKPLFPILDQQLLLLTISRLREAGAETIVINTHHLAAQIHRVLENEKNIIIQHEEEILGTGGGLRRALEHFNNEPVLVTNSDIFHNIDLAETYRHHYQADGDVTMVMHDYPRFNDVIVKENSRVNAFVVKPGAEDPDNRLAFTGIHVINPEVLKLIVDDRFSCILDCYRTLIQQGGTINARVVDNHFWTDMGTPDDYLDLHRGLLDNSIPPYPELASAIANGPFFISPDASIGKRVQFKDWISIGPGAVVGDNASLQRVVVWDGAEITPGTELSDTIVS